MIEIKVSVEEVAPGEIKIDIAADAECSHLERLVVEHLSAAIAIAAENPPGADSHETVIPFQVISRKLKK